MVIMDLMNLGYIEDPVLAVTAPKDKAFSELKSQLKATESDLDFREHATSTQQGVLPSCVGNATADTIEVLSSLQGFPKVELSRLFVWTLARMLMTRDGYKENTGTHIRRAYEALLKFGIPLESDWPYDTSKWSVLPPLSVMRKAAARKIDDRYKIKETGHERCEAVLTALKARHPVTFGTQIDKSWMSYKSGTKTPPKSNVIGGHAMVIVGFDPAKGFIVKNSWGSSWGEGGFVYLAPEYIAWSDTSDLWVPTIGRNFKP